MLAVLLLRSTRSPALEPAGREVKVTLVYPRDFTGAQDQVAVATPAGVAVLGLAVGQQIEWLAPNRQTVRARILDITCQPERAGDYQL